MSRAFVIEEHCLYVVEVPDEFALSPAQMHLVEDPGLVDTEDADEIDLARAEAFFLARGPATFPVEVDQREVYPMEVEEGPPANVSDEAAPPSGSSPSDTTMPEPTTMRTWTDVEAGVRPCLDRRTSRMTL